MKVQPTQTFIGFSGWLLGAALICLPVLGGGGIIAAIVTIYFCLVFLNGGAKASGRSR